LNLTPNGCEFDQVFPFWKPIQLAISCHPILEFDDPVYRHITICMFVLEGKPGEDKQVENYMYLEL